MKGYHLNTIGFQFPWSHWTLFFYQTSPHLCDKTNHIRSFYHVAPPSGGFEFNANKNLLLSDTLIILYLHTPLRHGPPSGSLSPVGTLHRRMSSTRYI